MSNNIPPKMNNLKIDLAFFFTFPSKRHWICTMLLAHLNCHFYKDSW